MSRPRLDPRHSTPDIAPLLLVSLADLVKACGVVPERLCDGLGFSLEQLQQAFDLDGKVTHISASIGVALWPRDSLASTELIHYADRAMYEAKRLGRNRLAHHACHASINTPVAAGPPG